jgi:hypothetical protein
VTDLGRKTGPHDERVVRREPLVGAMVGGVLGDLEIDWRADQVRMRAEEPEGSRTCRRLITAPPVAAS